MKNFISVFYRYRPIRKLSLSGFIGIGRYEKKLIGDAVGVAGTHFEILDFLKHSNLKVLLASFNESCNLISSNFWIMSRLICFCEQ